MPWKPLVGQSVFWLVSVLTPLMDFVLVGMCPRPEDPPAVIVTDPSGEKGNALEQYSHEGPPFSGTVEDRQRVYGSNILPVRKTRTLLQLMWLALKDRVLVRPTRFPAIQLPLTLIPP
jgi:Ca2+-transporting ATPase